MTASIKQTIIGAVLKRALAVPAGIYFKGARNMETVKALQNMILIIITKTLNILKIFTILVF